MLHDEPQRLGKLVVGLFVLERHFSHQVGLHHSGFLDAEIMLLYLVSGLPPLGERDAYESKSKSVPTMAFEEVRIATLYANANLWQGLSDSNFLTELFGFDIHLEQFGFWSS